MTANPSKKNIADQIQSLTVLVVDDNQYMRKMIRNLLVNCGIKDIYEANDGIAALDAIRSIAPDVVILDWEMPLLSGAELVRLGVHEYLIKPVSAKALYDRLVSIMMQPRPVVQLGDYYGPEPRKLMSDSLDDAPIIETPAVAMVE